MENQDSGEVVEAAAPPVESDMQTQEQEERQVPLDALQAERAQRQQLQDELRSIREQMSLMQYQQTQGQQKNDDPYSDDDVITWGELKKTLQEKERQYQTSLKEMQIQQKYPDYEQVVTKYLPEVLKQHPGLRQSLQQTQDYELAYTLAKQSDAYRKENKSKKRNEDAERMLANAKSPGSLSSVGDTSPVSQAKRYKDMPESEFRKIANQNLGYF